MLRPSWSKCRGHGPRPNHGLHVFDWGPLMACDVVVHRSGRHGSRHRRKSTSALGFLRNITWTFVSLHAIEPTRPRGRRRVDGVESPRHRVMAPAEI